MIRPALLRWPIVAGGTAEMVSLGSSSLFAGFQFLREVIAVAVR
jgi:hypothetical protein